MVTQILIALTVLSSFLAVDAYAQEHDPAFVQKVVDLTNAERRANGVRELRVSGFLQQAAQIHADDQSRRNYFGHNSPEGLTPRDRILALGYEAQSTTGENIYNGFGSTSYTSPEAALTAWMASPGHRANILNPIYTELGVGLAITVADGKHIYVQNFGSAAVNGDGSWGAIAYSPKLGAAIASKDKASAAAALAEAMSLCSNASDDCTLALSYRKGCGVVKRDPSTGAWGAGLAGGNGMPAINAAGMQARQRCVQSGGQDCNELILASCSL